MIDLNYKGFPRFPTLGGISPKNVISAVFPFQLSHSAREEEKTSGSSMATEPNVSQPGRRVKWPPWFSVE